MSRKIISCLLIMSFVCGPETTEEVHPSEESKGKEACCTGSTVSTAAAVVVGGTIGILGGMIATNASIPLGGGVTLAASKATIAAAGATATSKALIAAAGTIASKATIIPATATYIAATPTYTVASLAASKPLIAAAGATASKATIAAMSATTTTTAAGHAGIFFTIGTPVAGFLATVCWPIVAGGALVLAAGSYAYLRHHALKGAVSEPYVSKALGALQKFREKASKETAEALYETLSMENSLGHDTYFGDAVSEILISLESLKQMNLDWSLFGRFVEELLPAIDSPVDQKVDSPTHLVVPAIDSSTHLVLSTTDTPVDSVLSTDSLVGQLPESLHNHGLSAEETKIINYMFSIRLWMYSAEEPTNTLDKAISDYIKQRLLDYEKKLRITTTIDTMSDESNIMKILKLLYPSATALNLETIILDENANWTSSSCPVLIKCTILRAIKEKDPEKLGEIYGKIVRKYFPSGFWDIEWTGADLATLLLSKYDPSNISKRGVELASTIQILMDKITDEDPNIAKEKKLKFLYNEHVSYTLYWLSEYRPEIKSESTELYRSEVIRGGGGSAPFEQLVKHHIHET